jgi:transposase-like protein
MVACGKKEQAMSEKSRKSFTSQHKAKVALEAVRGIKTLNEIAQEFAVHPTQVGEWKKAASGRGALRWPKNHEVFRST